MRVDHILKVEVPDRITCGRRHERRPTEGLCLAPRVYGFGLPAAALGSHPGVNVLYP